MHQPDSCPVDALRACVFLVLQQEKLGPLQKQSNKNSKETLEDVVSALISSVFLCSTKVVLRL